MSASSPSIFSKVIIESTAAGSVDIRSACASIDIYEDIFCPTISAKITVLNAGGSLEGGRNGLSLYDGAQLRGGERVSIKIKSNSRYNIDIDFNKSPLLVNKIKNMIRDSGKEMFTISLMSQEAIANETSFLVRSYSKEARISDHVKAILGESFDAPYLDQIDETANKYGFLGNQMKPFEALMKLASKSVPSSGGKFLGGGGNGTAGYFFYQTRRGFNFRSVDDMFSQSSKADYFYSEVAGNDCDFVPTPQLPTLDRKIVSYSIDKN